ncbi:hypothetical protein F4553_000644 [Allocatelliglobosispora scoriae]|uniref:Uncharacterized protein n=1 Tax=Allocatelliglobosispora scoriae TaxID=643052 RepID=A0A841BI14_9ACTN|nr:hypothetical protein [Allocatelliglobosispora scoriae]MBB5867265.1 hypothetical protein [Allocatelliglobosispora scoriae]
MTGDQWVLVITAVVTALSGLGGTVLGGWITQRGADAGKRSEEVARARVALLRLATTLVADATDDAMAVAEEAAVASIALGYESGTALKILDAMRSWARFEPGGFPRIRARDEILSVLDTMLAESLPPGKRLSKTLDLQVAVSRPD